MANTYFTDYVVEKGFTRVPTRTKDGGLKVKKERQRWISAIGDRKDGKKVGRWFIFARDGIIRSLDYWEDGRLKVQEHVRADQHYNLESLIVDCRIKKLTKERLSKLKFIVRRRIFFYPSGNVQRIEEFARVNKACPSSVHYYADTKPKQEIKKITYWGNGRIQNISKYNRETQHCREKNLYTTGELLSINNLHFQGSGRPQVLHGLCTSYYKNGKVKTREEYNMGERDGWSYVFRPNGKLVEKKLYEDGIIITAEGSQKRQSVAEPGIIFTTTNSTGNWDLTTSTYGIGFPK